MKLRFKLLLSASLILILGLALTACSGKWGTPYPSLDEQGYTVSVKFDANGGTFAGTNDVTVIDVFSPALAETNAKGEKLFHLVSPDDPIRKEGAFTVSRTNYFLAGWYTERTLRTDASGAALDDYGVLTSVSGRAQGYTYAGLWNFDEDALALAIDGTESSDSPVLTLYAAWIPYMQYEIYTDSGAYIDTVSLIDIDAPKWSESTGKMDARHFPVRDGMTLDAAYLDAACVTPMTERISATAYVDYETGTLTQSEVRIYTKWLEGDWFRIYNAKQFLSSARVNGNYILCADLDFTGAVWPPAIASGKFTGTILGNGYKIANVTIVQGDNSKALGGLFGALDASARLEDIVFENIVYTVSAGSRIQGASFGLLAGSISGETTLTDVSITGTLYISKKCYPQSDYQFGLLCGIGSAEGVDVSGITCLPAEEDSGMVIEIAEDGAVSVEFPA